MGEVTRAIVRSRGRATRRVGCAGRGVVLNAVGMIRQNSRGSAVTTTVRVHRSRVAQKRDARRGGGTARAAAAFVALLHQGTDGRLQPSVDTVVAPVETLLNRPRARPGAGARTARPLVGTHFQNQRWLRMRGVLWLNMMVLRESAPATRLWQAEPAALTALRLPPALSSAATVACSLFPTLLKRGPGTLYVAGVRSSVPPPAEIHPAQVDLLV